MNAAVTPLPVAGKHAKASERRVLSADPASPFYVAPDNPLRQYVCLLAPPRGEKAATLVVSQSHQTDRAVAAFLHRLRLQGVAFEIKRVLLEHVQGYYAESVSHEDAEIVDSPTKQKVIALIREAAKLDASDVKFQIVGSVCTVRYKIHGRSHSHHQYSADEGYRLVRTLYNTMTDQAGNQLDETRMQDGQLRADFASLCGLSGSRIATKPAHHRGLLMTLRLLYQEKGEFDLTIKTAGYLPEQQDMFRHMMRLKYGINLLSGVTGSGKSTSLVATLKEVLRENDQELDLITIEDPIEYELNEPSAMQTPLIYDERKPNSQERAWSDALRNCLRHAPNILMPGELRDAESAQIAFDVALSGHVVWSTVHTFDIFSILNRLKRLGVDEDLLTNPALMTGLINQSLVRTLCPRCKRPLAEHPDALPADVMEQLEASGGSEGVYVMGADPSCPRCHGAGEAGRKVVAEVCVPTAELMQVYREQGMLAARTHWVKHMGGITKTAHVLIDMHAGLVDPRHAIKDVGPLDHDIRTLGVAA